MTTYGFLPIAGIVFIIYLISYFLTKTKYLKFPTHRRIWNLILLVSFLVAGSMGIFMAFIYSFELNVEIPDLLLKIHVGFELCGLLLLYFIFYGI